MIDVSIARDTFTEVNDPLTPGKLVRCVWPDLPEIMYLSMLCRRGWGGGRRALGGDLIVPWGRAFEWSCSPRGGDIWILEVFDCRLGRKRLRPNICFPLPCFTHAPHGLERSGNHGGRQRKQAKAGWISLFCLQISFALACFWSIEPLKILWYQSKRK